MSETRFDMVRIEELIAGAEPKGLHEELFVLGCKYGMSGETLKVLLWQISGEYEKFDHIQKDFLYLGYMLGQDIYCETNDDIEKLMSEHIKGKKTTH